MITGFIALVLLVPLIAAAGNGEWGTVAVTAVLIVLVLAFGVASREQDRAYNNFVGYWANRGEPKRRTYRRKRQDSRQGKVTAREEREAAEKRRLYAAEMAQRGQVKKAPQGKAVVCHFCGRFAKVYGEYFMTADGRMFQYRCPNCGKVNMTKVGT